MQRSCGIFRVSQGSLSFTSSPVQVLRGAAGGEPRRGAAHWLGLHRHHPSIGRSLLVVLLWRHGFMAFQLVPLRGISCMKRNQQMKRYCILYGYCMALSMRNLLHKFTQASFFKARLRPFTSTMRSPTHKEGCPGSWWIDLDGRTWATTNVG